MTDTTTEAVEGLACRIERHAEPMDSIKIKDVLDMSAHCGVATWHPTRPACHRRGTGPDGAG